MKKKNTLPIKWMLGVLVLLMAVVFCTHQTAKNTGTPVASNVSSPNNFFQFVLYMMGLGNQNIPASPTSGKNNIPNQKNLNSGQAKNSNTANQQNSNSMPTGNLTASGNSKIAQTDGNKGNGLVNNTGNISGNNPENNAQNNSQNNTQTNSENNQWNNPGNNSPNISDNSEQNNSDNNIGNYPDNNSGNGSGNNSGNNSGGASGNGSGNDSGSNSGSDSGSDSGNNSGNNSGGYNQYNLPTINPIPTDAQVSQTVTQQNKQNDSLAALLAAHQALVVPVQQQAQALKYQTVTSQSIPAVSTNQAPADVVEKVKSSQVAITH